MNIAIVTGASSGIGREFVKIISERYKKLDEIWVIARRRERLMELSDEVSAKLRIFDVDLCSKEGMMEIESALEFDRPNVRLLINSAGFGYLSDFENAECKIWTSMLELNCSVLTEMCHKVLPFMKKGARIINLASGAAFVPQPGFNVYAATKSYVLSFSRALGAELAKREITVTAVCPGPVKTEFFEVADPNNTTAFFKKMIMADPKRVANRALEDARFGKDISVYGGVMKIFMFFTKILPHKLFINIMKW